jgi:hypothetical protein
MLAVPPSTVANSPAFAARVTLALKIPADFRAVAVTSCPVEEWQVTQVPFSAWISCEKPALVSLGSVAWQRVQRLLGSSGGVGRGKVVSPAKCALTSPSATNL